MTSTKKRITAALMAAILATTFATPATAAETPTIRVSSYKGSTLKVGERSGIIIGPSGTDYTVISSSPDTVAVEQVLTFWVAVAKAEGSVEITVSNSTGECGSVTLTVSSAAPVALEASASGDNASLTDNTEIRQEIIRLINQTRKASGVSELPINESLMESYLIGQSQLMLAISLTAGTQQFPAAKKLPQTTFSHLIPRSMRTGPRILLLPLLTPSLLMQEVER